MLTFGERQHPAHKCLSEFANCGQIALSRLREWDEAILDLEAALALQPGNSAVQWELEQCKTQLGQQGVRGEDDCGDHASEDDIEEEDYENEEESLLPMKKVRFAIPMQPSLLE